MSRSTNITKVEPSPMVRPDWMGESARGTELLKQYVVLPRVKCVQGMASEELKAQFGVGDLILTPTNVALIELPRDAKGNPILADQTPVLFVPIFFWPEWITVNPREITDEPMIVERSVDPNSELAQKCKDRNRWFEDHPKHIGKENMRRRNIECLNFAIRIHSGPLKGEMAVLSFSKSEWFTGSRFSGLIKMRNADIFGCVFQMQVAARKNAKGNWFGIDVTNPSPTLGSPWVTQDEYVTFKKIYEELLKTHQDARLTTTYDEDDYDSEQATDTM